MSQAYSTKKERDTIWSLKVLEERKAMIRGIPNQFKATILEIVQSISIKLPVEWKERYILLIVTKYI